MAALALEFLYLIAISMTVLAIGACNSEPETTPYWPMHTIDNAFEGADGVDLNDIDADGDMDFLVGWEESGRAMLYENPGPHNVFQSWHRTDISTGLDVRKIEDAKFADFNGDGNIDAVVSATENRNEKVNIHWLVDQQHVFNGDSWKSASLDPSIKLPFLKVAIGQIDGTGPNDIVVGSKGDSKPGRLLWYQAPESANYANSDQWKGRPISEIYWINTIEILDMDQDGDNDVLVSDWSMLAWFENPGEATELEASQSNWTKHLISEVATSSFTNCAVNRNDPSQIHLVVGAVAAQVPVTVGDAIFYSIRKDMDEAGHWSGRWIESKLSSLDPIPSEIDRRDYDLKGVACGNIDDNADIDLVASASGYGNGVFALMNLQREPGDQSLHLKVISSDQRNTRKGIKHDNLLLNDLDGDGDLDVVTTEENGNMGSYLFPRGLGLIWFENPL